MKLKRSEVLELSEIMARSKGVEARVWESRMRRWLVNDRKRSEAEGAKRAAK